MHLPAFLLLALLSMSLVTSSAYAEEEGGGHEKKAEGGEHGEKKEGGEKEKSKGPSDITGGRFAGDPVYVHLSPFVIPVITYSGNQQIVTLLIDVEVRDFDVADDIHTNISKITDALVRALYGGFSDGDLRNGKLVNLTKVKARVTKALTGIVGGDAIKDVLIQGVAQRIL